ncbi:MAG TPA: serine/threonine-protein kinase [Haliangiales bacterium]|nr:serine/threonine-protein kinase [Haliangiales bacterium]
MASPDPAGTRSRTKSRLRGVVPGVKIEASPPPRTIGRYEILAVIGRGAMGVVYKARDPLLDRTVALKTIHAPATLGERVRRAYLERFEREAKAAARISHPAIVTIFDVGLDVEQPFLVMEYLPGETLADRLDRERMGLPQAYESARELASALGCAHRERIVHRDVKPANVLYAGDQRWKLADFGIARMPDSDLTVLGTFMGTPGYSPPEAVREGRYTVQADVFAWGALFYELLSGVIPYEGPDTETTNKKVLAAEPASPRAHDPRIPEPLAEVCLRALAHDPARRYPEGTAVAQALVDAWHRALRSGAIPVSAFAGVASPTPPPPSRNSAPPPTRPAPAPTKPAAPAKAPKGEDQTLIDLSPPAGMAMEAVLAAAPAPMVREERSAAREAAQVVRPSAVPAAIPAPRPRGSALRWIALVAAALAALAAIWLALGH